MKARIVSIGLVLTALAFARQASATVTVQGWWHFDSPPGAAPNILLDSSGNGRNYQQSGIVNAGGFAPLAGALVSSDAAGGLLGTNGYTSSHSLRLGLQGDSDTFWNTGYVPPASNYCVEVWIKPQDKGGYFYDGNPVWIFSSGGLDVGSGKTNWGGACVRMENAGASGVIVAGINVGANSVNVVDFGPQIPVDTNNWMHLALVNTDGVVSFYTNGVLCAVNPNGNETPPGGVMHLGTDGAWDGFVGFMDEERVFTFTNASDFSLSNLLYAVSPRIIQPPQATTVWSNGAATFQVAVSPDPCDIYQWYLNGTGAPGGAGATTADLYLNSVVISDSGKSYDCAVTNSCAGNGLVTSSATLTVVPVNPDNVDVYRNAVTGEPGLVAYYPADGDTGLTLTDTKGGHNGTFQGGADYDGQTNRAFGNRAILIGHGDGSVQIPNSSAFEFGSGNGTVEALIYLISPVTPEPNTYATIFSEASSDGSSIHYQLGVSVDGGTLVCTNDSGVKLTWAVPVNLLNRFAHVAFVFSGGTSVTAYADGQSLGTKSQSGFGTGGAPCWIGFGPALGSVLNSAPGNWHGTIDELAVYSSALAGTNIAIHYSKFVFGTNTLPPSITSQTTGPQTLFVGGSPVLTVFAAGTPPLNYQWYSNGVAIAGATFPTLTLHPTTAYSATYSNNVVNVYGHAGTAPIALTFVNPPSVDPSVVSVMADNPAAFWRLNELAGPTAVDCAGGNNGTFNASGVTYGVAGPPGDPETAVQFDGTAGRVVVPNTTALNPNGPFTIEFWARRLAGGIQGPVSSMVPARSGGYEFYVGGNFGGYEFHTAASGGYNMITGEDAAPTLGNWTHVVGVCDGSNNLSLYVNGYLVSTNNNVVAGTAPFTANVSNPFYIGCRRTGTDAFFNGAMSGVAFYNYALSSTQILHHLAVGLPQKLAIVASTNIVADSNPNGGAKDALNNGATWLASDAGRSGVMKFTPTLTTDNEISLFSYPQIASTNGTIMFWMRSAGVVPSGYNNGDDGCIILWRMPGVPGGGMFIGLEQSGLIQLQGGFNQPHCDSGSTTVNDNTWHNVAMTFDQSSATVPDLILYIDGVQVGSGPAAYDWVWPNQNFTMQIGADTIGYDSYWNDYSGELDDIRIYNTILAPADINTAMGGGLLTTNLLLRYNFDTAPNGYAVTWPYGDVLTAPNVTGPYSLPGGLTNQPPFSSLSPFPIAQPTASHLGRQFFRANR